MAKYYSTIGDKGSTSLLGETRVPKSHPRIRAVGTIDEASASLGFSRATLADEELGQILQTIQLDLYRLMSQIVLEEPDPEKFPDLAPERVTWLEEIIEKYQTGLQDPKGFILPGDNPGSASLSMARTVVRRAEREVVDLEQSGLLYSKTTLPYLNRLSSLCFVLELYTANQITPVSSKRS